MRKLFYMFLFFGLLFSCKNEKSENQEAEVENKLVKVDTIDSKTTVNVIKDSPKVFQNKKASNLNDEALAFVKVGDYNQAKKLFNQSLKIEPKSAPVYNNLGLIAYNENNVQLASDYYNKSIMIDSTYYTAFINFSSMLLENDYFAKSIDLNNYIILNCKDLELIGISHFFNSYAYLKMKKCDIAKNHYKLARDILGKNPSFSLKLEDVNKQLIDCK